MDSDRTADAGTGLSGPGGAVSAREEGVSQPRLCVCMAVGGRPMDGEYGESCVNPRALWLPKGVNATFFRGFGLEPIHKGTASEAPGYVHLPSVLTWQRLRCAKCGVLRASLLYHSNPGARPHLNKQKCVFNCTPRLPKTALSASLQTGGPFGPGGWGWGPEFRW